MVAINAQALTFSFVAWELLYWLATAALRIPRARASLSPVVLRDAPAYAVSTVHALFAAARGVRHLVRLWGAPNVVKLCVPPPTAITEPMIPFLPESSNVILTNVSLAGYLLSDLIHVLWHYPNLGKMDTVAHHVAFLICALVAGTYQLYPFAFAWLIVGEASTPLLNLRWFLIRQGHGASRTLVHVSSAFGAVFFLTRFWIYGAGLLHLFFSYSEMPEEISGFLSAGVLCFLVFGFCLNLIWLRRIVAIAFAPPRRKEKNEDTVAAAANCEAPAPKDVQVPKEARTHLETSKAMKAD